MSIDLGRRSRGESSWPLVDSDDVGNDEEAQQRPVNDGTRRQPSTAAAASFTGNSGGGPTSSEYLSPLTRAPTGASDWQTAVSDSDDESRDTPQLLRGEEPEQDRTGRSNAVELEERSKGELPPSSSSSSSWRTQPQPHTQPRPIPGVTSAASTSSSSSSSTAPAPAPWQSQPRQAQPSPLNQAARASSSSSTETPAAAAAGGGVGVGIGASSATAGLRSRPPIVSFAPTPMTESQESMRQRAISGTDSEASVTVPPSFARRFVRRSLQVERMRCESLKKSFDFGQLRGSPTFNVLAAYHTYGMWLAAAYVICFSGNFLLSWYVDWYKAVPTTGSIEDFPYMEFFMIFLRSWLLVGMASEFVRFSCMLAREAWNLDTFGGYRRAVLGLVDMDQTATSFGSWPEVMGQTRICLDEVFQICIYLSFEGVPIGLAFWIVFRSWETSGDWNWYVLTVALWEGLLAVSAVHVLIYFLAWTINDVVDKVKSFRKAVQADRRDFLRNHPEMATPSVSRSHRSFQGDAMRAAAREQAQEAYQRGRVCCRRLRRDCRRACQACTRYLKKVFCCRWRRFDSESDARLLQEGSFAAVDHEQQGVEWDRGSSSSLSGARRKTRHVSCQVNFNREAEVLALAERRHIWIFCCGWLTVVQWNMIFVLAVVAAAVGAAYLRRTIVSVLCIVGVLLLLLWRCHWPWSTGEADEEAGNVGEQASGGSTSRPRMKMVKRQAWGERTCALDTPTRSWQHKVIAFILIVQGTLFWTSKQYSGTKICSILLGAVFVREVIMHYEGNGAWIIAILEGLVVWTAVAVLQFSFRSEEELGFLTLGMIVAHEFGLRRCNTQGYRIQKFVLALLFFYLLMVVALVVITSTSLMQPSATSDWSQFKPGGKNYTIPYKDTSQLGLQCDLRFDSGQSGQGLSIGDFALLSSLAYESPHTLEASLQHFFPGWKLKYERIAQEKEINGTSKTADDWTTFFEFANEDESVSVVAIRGTDSTLDILSDINLWAPAAFLQLFELVGPWMSIGVSQAIAYLVLKPLDQYYNQLMSHTATQQKKHPERTWYMTGHSLGGGLAKLVGGQLGIEAITFMAPGVERTLYLSLNQAQEKATETINTLLRHAVTIQPRSGR